LRLCLDQQQGIWIVSGPFARISHMTFIRLWLGFAVNSVCPPWFGTLGVVLVVCLYHSCFLVHVGTCRSCSSGLFLLPVVRFWLSDLLASSFFSCWLVGVSSHVKWNLLPLDLHVLKLLLCAVCVDLFCLLLGGGFVPS
jgi:hypothetical protein